MYARGCRASRCRRVRYDHAVDHSRLDTWLWCARVYKTRSQAKDACDAGHVSVNGDRAKPATTVRVGDEVRARAGDQARVLRVASFASTRGPAPVARTLFNDLTPPPPPRAERAATREAGAGRPTKRERRETDRWRGRE